MRPDPCGRPAKLHAVRSVLKYKEESVRFWDGIVIGEDSFDSHETMSNRSKVFGFSVTTCSKLLKGCFRGLFPIYSG